MKTNACLSLFTLTLIALVLMCGLAASAQDDASASPAPTVRQAVGFAVSAPVSELAKMPQPAFNGVHEALPVRRIAKPDSGVAVDPVQQSTAIAPAIDYSIGLNFLGVGNGFFDYIVPDAPPDTNMAVGDTEIIQWVNVSFAVFDKSTGAPETGPIAGNLLWSALPPGSPCAMYNDGDIIAQYDNAAHRWMMAQHVFHGPTYYACVAVPTTPSALGPYYLYQFSLGTNFPDYPKWGRWTNSWVQTMNMFNPSPIHFLFPEVCAYDRTKLLNGNPTAGQVCFQLNYNDDSLLPGDIDSATPPPSLQDEFLIGSVNSLQGGTNQLSLYTLHMVWTPFSASITGANNSQRIIVQTYSGPCPFGALGGNCVPQLGVSDNLDSLGDRLMYRFAYSNDPPGVGAKQHWYVNHSVQVPGGQIGVRWY